MKQILKQTSWLILAQVLTRIIGFFYTIFLARILGVSDFGLFTVALAYFSIVSSIADFGFNRFLVREVSKDHLKAAKLLWNITMLRLTLTSVTFAVFAVALYSFDPNRMRIYLNLLAVLAILPQSVALTFDGIFVAMGKLQFSAIALVFSSISTVFFGVYLINKGTGIFGAVNALIFGQVIYTLILLYFLYKNKILSLSEVTLPILKKALVGSLPYGLLGVLGLLYFRIDVIILSYIKGNFETGLYGAAYRFLEAIIFVPSAFAAALFPNLARLHDGSRTEMKRIYFKSLKLMAFLGIAIMISYILLLPQIIKLFLPNFLQSIDAIRILSLSIPFIFIATPGVQVLLSSEKYLKQVLVLSMFTVAFNIVLNLLFIPEFGLFAAAWVTVLSDILSFVIFYLLISRKIFVNGKN